jgi:Gliding motility associated protein GldN
MLKFYNPTDDDIPDEFTLQNYILKLTKEGKLPIYKDDNCTQLTTYDIALRNVDTLTDPNAYETRTCRLGVGNIYDEDILFFRAHQILHYDSSKVQFGLRTLAIAPMRKMTDEKGELINWEPVFWIKATDLTGKRNLSNDAITWAKRMELRNGVALKADNVKILKGFGDNEPVASLFEAIKKKAEIPFYDSYYTSIRTQFSMARRADFFTEKDSSKPFNITTYNIDEHHFPTNGIKVTDIKELRILQNWYWDNKKQQIEIWLSAVSPLVDMKNEAGEFLYKYPLFYRRTDD